MSRRHPPDGRADLPAHRPKTWVWGSIAGLAAILAAILAIVAWLVWPNPPAQTPRALQYHDFDVCLLVGNGGIAGDPAAATWAGLQEVTAETKVRLTHLKVNGPQTEEQAKLFIPTLAQQGCDVIVAVGPNQADAAKALTATYPNIRFLTVESNTDADSVAANVAALLPAT